MKNPEQQKTLGGVNFFGFKLKYNTQNDKIFWESVIEYWAKTDIIITNVDYKKEKSNSDGSGMYLKSGFWDFNVPYRNGLIRQKVEH